jgi:hypothetical protein
VGATANKVTVHEGAVEGSFTYQSDGRQGWRWIGCGECGASVVAISFCTSACHSTLPP